MDITIVIVSYRVKHFLEQTIRSAQEALEGLRGEIIVVDNNSGDDTMAFVKPKFPDVTFIENTENVGFARANNQAIMQARGAFTLILNPDTIITGESLRRPLQWMQEHPDCGAIGLHMIDGNGHFLPESKRAFPTPWVSFCKIFGLSKLFPRSRFFAKYHLRYLDEWQPHAIDILAGAYMLCRTPLLQQVGGFDEDFFMYGEDIDLSYRMVKAGYRNWYLPVNMLHYKGESTKKDSMRYVKVFYEAMLIFYRKHFPRFRTVVYPLIKLGVLVRQGMAVMRRIFTRICPRTSATALEDRAGWVILSQTPEAVAQVAGIKQWTTSIPQEGAANVLLDDASLSYQQIVDTIAASPRHDVFFHIYAHHSRIVITPKMN
ncbi:MAG: glycosyltransferase family 2 protein [Bacteroidales bacterium]|nr:glycosyltransferase family 2 protein [Bacteroidales bacterium]